MLDRPLHREAVALFSHVRENHLRQTLFNIRKLLDTRDLLGRPLERSLARQLLTLPKHETLEDWLQSLPAHAGNPEEAAGLVEQLRECIDRRVGPDRVASAGPPIPAAKFKTVPIGGPARATQAGPTGSISVL